MTIQNLEFSNLQYNEKNNHFTITVNFELNYHDNRLKWEPESYENITTYLMSYIWKPTFLISEDIYYLSNSIAFKYEATVKHTGDVFLRTMDYEIKVWCDRKNVTNKQTNYCDLQIFLEEAGVQVVNQKNISENQLDSLNKKSSWKVDGIEISKVKHKSHITIIGQPKELETNFRFYLSCDYSDRLNIFYSTLLGGLTLLMLSAWMSDILKFALILFAVFVFVLSLVLTSSFAPVIYIPKIGKCILSKDFSLIPTIKFSIF